LSGGPRDLRVLFVHGLESSPGSAKSLYLSRFFDAETPAMDTSNFEGAVAHQARRLKEFGPDVLVGSSFGGAVALALVGRGFFRGGVVLLAPAHRHFGVEERIPPRTPVVIAHGVKDDVVSIEGSRALAQTGTPGYVELVEVDDGHRLATLLEGDQLASMVRRARDMLL
jgi:pimeloyl-ACP methyl ester carboxylesterase